MVEFVNSAEPGLLQKLRFPGLPAFLRRRALKPFASTQGSFFDHCTWMIWVLLNLYSCSDPSNVI